MPFRKSRVDKDTLGEIAVILGTEIGAISIVSASLVDEFYKNETNFEVNRAQYTQVVLEFIYLFVQLTDRILFWIVKFKEDRSWFLNLLYAQIVEWFRTGKAISKNLPPDISSKFKKFKLALPLREKIKVSNCYRDYRSTLPLDRDKPILGRLWIGSFLPEEMNERNMEYGECDLCPAEKYGGWKNTVFRKFAEHVSEIVTGETGFTWSTYSSVMNIMGLSIQSSTNLGIREKLEKISQR